jgi:hypothetical protein
MKVRNELQAKAILAEIHRRKLSNEQVLFDKRAVALSPADEQWFIARCGGHIKQLEFVADESKKLALKCPRRTGKTMAQMFKALRLGKRFPGSMIAYIVPSSKHHAQRLFWRPLEQLEQQFKLGLQFKVAEHKVLTRENTAIYVFGAKNKESPRVLRGNAWAAAFLDECKDFGPHFEELMIEAVLPGLEDYDGQLILGGTPGDVLDGTFYRITDPAIPPDGWSVHKWVKSDNAHLPANKRDLAIIEQEEYAPFGLTKASPKFRREQLAEWCTDESERAYMYDSHRNGWLPDAESGEYKLPTGHRWMHVLGIDLGETDANAFVVGAFSPSCRDLYIVHEFARARMSIDEIAGHVKQLQEEFGPFVEMVADTGGYGRGVVTDMQLRHNLPLVGADKTGNKLGNIALMNADFLCGKIKAKSDGPLAMEWKRLTRRIRVSDKKVLISHSDLGDAALYMWKASRHYASREQEDAPQPGTPESYNLEERTAIQHAINRRRARQAGWGGSALSDFCD